MKTVHGDGAFGQRAAVETLVVKSMFTAVNPRVPYVDPDGRAGQYVIGIMAANSPAPAGYLLWLARLRCSKKCRV
jgi:hypothetical protein